MSQLLTILSAHAAQSSTSLVDCRGCIHCCERGGPVYVHPDEVEKLGRLGTPLVTVDGVTFIKRHADGACPMLDRIGRKCSIYGDRPLCCRLFPLDILSRDGKLQWAVATICPDDRKRFKDHQSRDSDIGTGTVARMASALDDCLTARDAAYFEAKERVGAHVELLEDSVDWTFLVECTQNPQHPKVEMSRTETKKEKLKRKLKEKKKKKKRKK